eukprot:1964294-Alexandrium_andersonii.AAC.1
MCCKNRESHVLGDLASGSPEMISITRAQDFNLWRSPGSGDSGVKDFTVLRTSQNWQSYPRIFGELRASFVRGFRQLGERVLMCLRVGPACRSK